MRLENTWFSMLRLGIYAHFKFYLKMGNFMFFLFFCAAWETYNQAEKALAEIKPVNSRIMTVVFNDNRNTTAFVNYFTMLN